MRAGAALLAVACLPLLAGCGWVQLRVSGSERGIDRTGISIPIERDARR